MRLTYTTARVLISACGTKTAIRTCGPGKKGKRRKKSKKLTKEGTVHTFHPKIHTTNDKYTYFLIHTSSK
jgi:hypothetical protein